MPYRNIRLHPVLRILYLLLRLLVWLGITVFYRRRLVLGREHLRFDGPAIVIANHPSTLLDALNPALLVHQEMFFLANYGLFKNLVSNWLLRRLYCIPVKRREDVAEGEARNNDEAFEQSYRHLEKNGVLFIAPEGTSWMNRFVRSLKSGTARIAFGAEARNNWHLGVKIIPIGLSYSAPHRFRSDLVAHVGPPVYASEWAEAWREDPGNAVDDLTQYLAAQLRRLSVHTRDEVGEQLITRLEEILQNEFPLAQRAAYERSQHLAHSVLDNDALYGQTTAYYQELQQHQMSDAVVAASRKPRLTGRLAGQIPVLILGLPLFLAGYACWGLPCFLLWLLNKKLDLYIGYSSTVKILAGLILFPFACWGIWAIGYHFTAHTGLAWLTLVGAIALGYAAELYQDLYHRCRTLFQALRLRRNNPGLADALLHQRAAILELIELENK